MRGWADKIRKECEGSPVLALLGNKLDLAEKSPGSRRVEAKEGRQLAEQGEMAFYETTVKRQEDIQSAIDDMLEAIVLKRAVRDLEILRERVDKQEEPPVCSICGLF